MSQLFFVNFHQVVTIVGRTMVEDASSTLSLSLTLADSLLAFTTSTTCGPPSSTPSTSTPPAPSWSQWTPPLAGSVSPCVPTLFGDHPSLILSNWKKLTLCWSLSTGGSPPSANRNSGIFFGPFDFLPQVGSVPTPASTQRRSCLGSRPPGANFPPIWF